MYSERRREFGNGGSRGAELAGALEVSEGEMRNKYLSGAAVQPDGLLLGGIAPRKQIETLHRHL
jgi:hypothetical protein